MAHAPQANEATELAGRGRKGWQFFLKFAKWFSLSVLGGIFFLIFTLVGHAPFIPVLVIMSIAVFVLGSIVH